MLGECTIYGFRPVLLETFVDPEKYTGTCYQAANWQRIGKTQGKKGSDRCQAVSPKDVYVYPLAADFKTTLVHGKKRQKNAEQDINERHETLSDEGVANTQPLFRINVKNSLVTMARNLELLFLQQAKWVAQTNMIDAISFCKQKERPGRKYDRASKKSTGKAFAAVKWAVAEYLLVPAGLLRCCPGLWCGLAPVFDIIPSIHLSLNNVAFQA